MQTFRRRFLDVLSSLYIYNEHRGYTSIDRVIEAVLRKCPEETVFIEAVAKHRADERKHYVMFRRYFELRGTMPFRVDRTCGHIDRLIWLTFGTSIDELDTDAIVADDALFRKLCRIILLTERRGMRQLDKLLKSPAVLSDKPLVRIFEVIRRDEPSHWEPYQTWLQAHGDVHILWIGVQKGPPWRGDRRPKGTPHFDVLVSGLGILRRRDWDVGGGDGGTDSA